MTQHSPNCSSKISCMVQHGEGVPCPAGTKCDCLSHFSERVDCQFDCGVAVPHSHPTNERKNVDTSTPSPESKGVEEWESNLSNSVRSYKWDKINGWNGKEWHAREKHNNSIETIIPTIISFVLALLTSARQEANKQGQMELLSEMKTIADRTENEGLRQVVVQMAKNRGIDITNQTHY